MDQLMTGGLERFERTDLGDLARGIFETAHCVVVFLDLKGKVTYLNPFAEKTLGWSADEVVGKDWIDGFIPKEERSRLRQELKELRKGKSTRSGGNAVICKDGSLCRLAWTDSVLNSQSGEPAGIAGIGIDVTREYLVRKEFEEQQTRIRAAMDNMVDGFITIDDRGIIESFNRAAERMFGYMAEEVLGRNVSGRNVSALMPGPDRSHHDDYIQDYLQTGDAKVIGTGREILAQRKDGETFPVSLAVGEMRFGGRTAKRFPSVWRWGRCALANGGCLSEICGISRKRGHCSPPSRVSNG
jgi:PAS domain S-box-containing protein